MTRIRRLAGIAVGTTLLAAAAFAGSDLERDFRDPPRLARPLVWWHWMNGNVTREGITADLEAMARVGLGGATVFDVWEKIPPGPVAYGSAAWREMLVHAAREAERLGLELSMQSSSGWSSSGGPWIRPELAMQKIVASETQVAGPRAFDEVLPKPPTIVDWYRDVAVLAFPSGPVLDRAKLVDLTAAIAEDGRLAWEVPEGSWTILRLGHTPTGAANRAATHEGYGLECDKLTRAGIEEHWANAVAPVLAELGPLVGGAFRGCLLDSYEVGEQDWTPRMREAFRARRGYDPVPFLPVLAGRTVDGAEASERFAWDLRRTVAELFASEYHGRFAELCRERGLESAIEPYSGPFDGRLSGARADVPMGEFWVHGRDERWCVLAASIGNVHGRPVVAAEAFTSSATEGAWQHHPATLKAVGDAMFAAGINRFAIHRYAHQPRLDLVPGMTMGPWGMHFERTTTWWDQGAAWVSYLSRCQAVLQAGREVRDLLFLAGEVRGDAAPVDLERSRYSRRPVPAGYRADTIGTDDLLALVTVREGNLVLPGGASYRLLVLLPSESMTPEVAAKLGELVEAGATIVGKPPTRSPSLRDLPAGDERVREIAKRIWGTADGETTRVHTLGRGRAFFGPTPEVVLELISVPPDCALVREPGDLAGDPPLQMRWTHRALDGADVYFLSNQEPREARIRASFRVREKRPEIWHPDTGAIEPAPVWRSDRQRTEVRLRLEPFGSAFVVFRAPADGIDPIAGILGPPCEVSGLADGAVEVRAFQAGVHQIERDSGEAYRLEFDGAPPPIELAGPWKVRFQAGRGAPEEATFPKLISWPDHKDAGVKHFSGTASYAIDFDLPAERLGAGRVVRLDLGRVECIADVSLNGTALGTWWKAPFAADVTPLVRAGKNRLEVRVTNLWVNRLVGDEQLPPDAEFVGKQLERWPDWYREGRPRPETGRVTFTTWRHYGAESPLLPSGLIGPARIVSGWSARIEPR